MFDCSRICVNSGRLPRNTRQPAAVLCQLQCIWSGWKMHNAWDSNWKIRVCNVELRHMEWFSTKHQASLISPHHMMYYIYIRHTAIPTIPHHIAAHQTSWKESEVKIETHGVWSCRRQQNKSGLKRILLLKKGTALGVPTTHAGIVVTENGLLYFISRSSLIQRPNHSASMSSQNGTTA